MELSRLERAFSIASPWTAGCLICDCEPLGGRTLVWDEIRKLEENQMIIRHATEEDVRAIAEVEAECFPSAEAATEKDFVERVAHYGNHFWLMFDEEKLIAFVDGFVTDEPDLTDEMYENAAMHNENGAWQMIFGVNTIPSYRRQGHAGRLINRAIEDAKKQGRKGLVLTCKDKLVHYYAGFGFKDEGVSEKSTHGNAVWHQMRLSF
jgi:predicted N-acetyltransferase YhbS